MKKFLAMILALVMVLAMVSVASAEDAMRVAMITDYGDITDQSFNQTTYEACKEWCGRRTALISPTSSPPATPPPSVWPWSKRPLTKATT